MSMGYGCPIHMSTNAGTKVIDLEAKLDGVGMMNYDPNGMANVIGMGPLIKNGCRIVMDTDKGNYFKVFQKYVLVYTFLYNNLNLVLPTRSVGKTVDRKNRKQCFVII